VDRSASLKVVGCDKGRTRPGERTKHEFSGVQGRRLEQGRASQEIVRERDGKGRREKGRAEGKRGVFIDVEKAARLTRARLSRSGRH
jgi:hypothetical protein